MSKLSIKWLGHSTFVITTPGGKRIVTDPWLEGNPACPPEHKRIEQADAILLSHGHFDHTGDIVNVARATGATTLAVFELSQWLERKGVQNVIGMDRFPEHLADWTTANWRTYYIEGAGEFRRKMLKR